MVIFVYEIHEKLFGRTVGGWPNPWIYQQGEYQSAALESATWNVCVSVFRESAGFVTCFALLCARKI